MLERDLVNAYINWSFTDIEFRFFDITENLIIMGEWMNERMESRRRHNYKICNSRWMGRKRIPKAMFVIANRIKLIVSLTY